MSWMSDWEAKKEENEDIFNKSYQTNDETNNSNTAEKAITSQPVNPPITQKKEDLPLFDLYDQICKEQETEVENG